MFSLLAQLGFVWLCSYQLLAQMNNVLSIQFPSPVPELLDFIKLMFLDVRNLIRLDCVKEPATHESKSGNSVCISQLTQRIPVLFSGTSEASTGSSSPTCLSCRCSSSWPAGFST